MSVNLNYLIDGISKVLSEEGVVFKKTHYYSDSKKEYFVFLKGNDGFLYVQESSKLYNILNVGDDVKIYYLKNNFQVTDEGDKQKEERIFVGVQGI